MHLRSNCTDFERFALYFRPATCLMCYQLAGYQRGRRSSPLISIDSLHVLRELLGSKKRWCGCSVKGGEVGRCLLSSTPSRRFSSLASLPSSLDLSLSSIANASVFGFDKSRAARTILQQPALFLSSFAAEVARLGSTFNDGNRDSAEAKGNPLSFRSCCKLGLVPQENRGNTSSRSTGFSSPEKYRWIFCQMKR